MLDLSLPQMTPGELKFALLLEHHLNSLPDPEYRQVVVESLMVVSLVASSSPQPTFGGTLVVEHIINHARDLFLQDQVSRHAYDIIFYGTGVPLLDHSGSTRAQQWTVVVTTLVAVEGLPVYVSISTTVHQVVAMAP